MASLSQPPQADYNYVLEIKTVQIAPFRTLMTALKDILLETILHFKKMVFVLLIWINHTLF